MIRKYRLFATTLAVVSMIAGVGPAYAKAKAKTKAPHQHSGQRLLGDKIHTNGPHVIDKVGKHTVSVVVKDGKIAGFKVKHSEKGDVLVKKYKTKTTEKLGQAGGTVMSFASYSPTLLAQSEDLGWTWIGYSFIDDYGYEQIYWFPYDMVYDGDTGAILYIPVG
jgi:hypothetical protein